MRPRRSLLICTTFRTGSTLLDEMLRSTGLAGAPREYFGGIQDPPHPAQMAWANTASEAEFIGRVIELGTSSNGVFAMKLHWPHFKQATRRLRAHLGEPGLAAPEAMARIFPNPLYLWLRRRDKVAQAVSFYRAILTDQWTRVAGSTPDSSPAANAFDFAAIERLRRQCVIWDACWDDYFRRTGILPITVCYEDFVQAVGFTIDWIIERLDVQAGGLRLAAPGIEKQADDLSLEWIARFRAEAG